ncbi:MAG: pilus assembly protein PilM [Solirubrobacterales bacterium]
MWKYIAGSQRIQPIGMDIGHSSVKLVQLAVCDDSIKVLAARRAPLGVDWDADDREREQAVIQVTRQLLADNHFRGRHVVSSLPIDKLKITSLRLSESEAPQAEKILRKEAGERFNLDPQKDSINYIHAGNVRQGEDARDEYILFGADRETIGNHIRVLEETGLTPVAIDAPPCALFRSFERTMRRQEDRERTIIFVDVGCRFTTVVFGRSGEICFVKQIPVGLGQFTEEIASALGIARADAESLRLRLRRDEPVDPATRRPMIDALNVMAEQLANEISLCLRYYTVTFRGKRVERAIVAGGGAYEQVLRDVLRRHLSVEVEVAEPLRGFDIRPGTVDDSHGNGCADLALAVGLSLKGWDAADANSRAVACPEPVLEGEPQ